MFSGSNITSTWGQAQPNQQQQQQQPGTSTFGQPATTSAFGTNTAFGGGGAFGQPQQQQQQQQPQQQSNPMFGGLGGAGSTTAPATTGFGGFGTTPSNAATTGNSIFGGQRTTPASGFGGFGTTGTPTFGGGTTGAFGGGTTGTGTSGGGIFGSQPTTSNATSAFGGTGLFGAKPATGFGTTTTNATAGSYDGVAPVTTGTSNPPYSSFNEKDGLNSATTLQYQSISCMPAYRGSSFEELRYQDYQQGRKTAGAFGQSTFGAPAAQTSTSIFGQPATSTQPTTSLFGGFGSNNAATAGSTNTTTNAFGGFGQPAAGASTQPATGSNLFGGGAFGQPTQPQQPQQPSNAFGGFGQQQQQQQQPQQQQQAGGMFSGGMFGAQSQQPKPFGGFGGTNTTNTFGTTGTTFGQPSGQQATGTGTGLFGQQQQQPQQQPTNAFGGFGNATANAAKPSLFAQPTQPTTTFGGFGTQPQQNQAAQPGTQAAGSLFGGGLFGQNQQAQQQQPQQPAGTGLFGGQQPTQPTAGSNLFGAGTGGSLFGNNTAQQQQQQQQPSAGFPLFNKPAGNTGTGLFGGFNQPQANNNTAPTQQPPSLFGTAGQTNTQPTNNLFGGATNNSLFAKPAAPLGTQPAQQTGTNLFGGSAPFNNTFGASANVAGQAVAPQGGLTASIAQPIGASLPIFNLLPPGPRAIPLEPPKKKSNLFADIQTRQPTPRLQLGYSPAVSKLRGFTTSSPSIPGSHGQSLGAQVSLTNGKPGVLSLSNNKSILGSDWFNSSVSSPGLGTGARQSVKKLVLNRKVEPSDLFGKSSKITFSPALSIAAREAEAAAASGYGRRDETPTPASRTQQHKPSGKFSAQATVDSVESADGPAGELKDGDYYVRPSLHELKKMSYAELLSVKNLVVGRVGYGVIEFLEPVDLTGLRRTTELLGDIIRFDDKECTVYPDSEEAEKPPPGQGLNVAARITLIHCWALDKATREPIKDEKHHGAIKHLNRLKKMKRTHFESFDIEEGKWVFTVDHF